MNIFALSSSLTSVEDAPDDFGSLLTKNTPESLLLDDTLSGVDGAAYGSISEFWSSDAAGLHSSFCWDPVLQQPSSLLFKANDSTSHKQRDSLCEDANSPFSIDSPSFLDFPIVPISSSNALDADNGIAVDMLAEEDERPGLLVELTVLLGEMCPYEKRLLKLSRGELDDYPIGDALFLSHRFHETLSEYSHMSSLDSATDLTTPTMLIAVSCFMTLIRIYSSIFNHLQEGLSRMLQEHSVNNSLSCAYLSSNSSGGADIRSYRGLQLGQLQTICLCASWNPTKKAVTMLLKALAGAERRLDLPPSIRIVAAPDTEEPDGPASGKDDREKSALFKESCNAALMNGRLYKTIKEQARELRSIIFQVEELLKGGTDMAFDC